MHEQIPTSGKADLYRSVLSFAMQSVPIPAILSVFMQSFAAITIDFAAGFKEDFHDRT